jgi:hypothetical protein
MLISVIIHLSDNWCVSDETIHSLFAQAATIGNIELIVIDSRVSASAKFEELQVNYPDYIRYVWKKDICRADALVLGVESARGKYVTCLETNITLKDGAFASAVAALDADSALPFSIVLAHNLSEATDSFTFIDLNDDNKSEYFESCVTVIRKKALLSLRSDPQVIFAHNLFMHTSLLLEHKKAIALNASLCTVEKTASELIHPNAAKREIYFSQLCTWMMSCIQQAQREKVSLPHLLQTIIASQISRMAVQKLDMSHFNLEKRDSYVSRLEEISSYISPSYFTGNRLLNDVKKMALLLLLEGRSFSEVFTAGKHARFVLDDAKIRFPPVKILEFKIRNNHLIIEGRAFLPPQGHFTPHDKNGTPIKWEEAPELLQNVYIFGRAEAVLRGFRIFLPLHGTTHRITLSGCHNDLKFGYLPQGLVFDRPKKGMARITVDDSAMILVRSNHIYYRAIQLQNKKAA